MLGSQKKILVHPLAQDKFEIVKDWQIHPENAIDSATRLPEIDSKM